MTDLTTLIAKLQSSFEKAHNAGDLYFFPSTVVRHKDSEIEVIAWPRTHTGLLIMSNFDLVVRDPALPRLAKKSCS